MEDGAVRPAICPGLFRPAASPSASGPPPGIRRRSGGRASPARMRSAGAPLSTTAALVCRCGTKIAGSLPSPPPPHPPAPHTHTHTHAHERTRQMLQRIVGGQAHTGARPEGGRTSTWRARPGGSVNSFKKAAHALVRDRGRRLSRKQVISCVPQYPENSGHPTGATRCWRAEALQHRTVVARSGRYRTLHWNGSPPELSDVRTMLPKGRRRDLVELNGEGGERPVA